MPSNTRDGILRGGHAALVRLMLATAAGVSAYLLSVSLSGGPAAGCGPGSACDAVVQSRWAHVFGVPVSALALIVDLALLATTFTCGPRSKPAQRRGAWEILAPGAVLVLGSALWFTALQAVVLRRFCPWCLAAHTAGAVASLLLLLRMPAPAATPGRSKETSPARSRIMFSCVAALVAVALLGLAQAFGPAKTYSVTVVTPAPATTVPNPSVATPPVTNPAAAAASPAKQPQWFEVFGGRIRLDLAQAPLWGSPAAPHKLISLYDYTCHHCRDMHERVVQVARDFGAKLAVISLPMPLDAQCNALIPRTHPKQANACQYARLGLAVWRAGRGAVEPYDDWFFSFPAPPPLAEATNKAVALVGVDALRRAADDPWIDTQLNESIQIYNISGRQYQNVRMPQFMIGTNIYTGMMTTEQLRAAVGAYVHGAGR